MPINIDGSKGIRQNTTEVTKIPVGTTAQRPANPEPGMIRVNTDGGQVEWYDEVTDVWVPISEKAPEVIASGGTVTDIAQGGQLFRVHTFTSDGTFEVARGGDVEYLVVGGGGAGGNGWGGGGGGGGVITGLASLSPQTYSIVVGAGGLQSSTEDGTSDNRVAGGDGGNSSAFGFTAIGGGGGGASRTEDGRPGGSGGGGARGTSGALGTPGQGNNGGNSLGGPWSDSSGIGAGGGGAGQPGFDSTAVANQSAKGGDGISSSITGFSVFYAGGGGGANSQSGDESRYDNRNAGLPGLGGGGRGQNRSNNDIRPTQSGAPNTGGGGGGSDTRYMPASFGGSGIVIVRYRIG